MNDAASSARRRSSRWPWALVLAIVVLLPLPFGGYRPWAWSAAGLAIAIAVGGWAFGVLRGRAPFAWGLRLWPAVALFGVAPLWAVIQALPLMPAAWINPVWAMAAPLLDRPLPGTISAAPGMAWPALIRLSIPAGVFWLALHYGRDRDRAYAALRALSLAAGAYALYGLVNYVLGNDRLLWFPRLSYRNDVTGTFVNRNSYATFAGLGLLVAVTMAIRSFRTRWRLADPAMAPAARAIEATAGWPAIHATIAVVGTMAWLQSHSRMGFAATLAGLVVLLGLFRAVRIVRGWLVIGLAAAGGLATALLVSGAGLLARMGSTEGFDRSNIFHDVLRMIESAPLVGSGYGSFAATFPMYRDPTTVPGTDIVMAHNTYYELAAEIGIPAAAGLIGAIVWLAGLCAVGVFRRTRDQAIPVLAVAATMLVGIHSTVDFSLQMPAVAAVYAMLLGLGVAQSWSPDRGRAR